MNESSANNNGDLTELEKEEEVKVAVQEDRWVFWLRLLTACVLVGVAVLVCVVVYQEGRQGETAAFEEEFSHLGEKLVRSFESLVAQRFGILDSFAQGITSDADGLFPFVTPPNYAFRAERVVDLAQLFFIIFVPIVPNELVEDWNTYARQNQHWKKEGVAQQRGVLPDELDEEELTPLPPVMLNVHNPNGPAPAQNVTPDNPFFYPIWSTFPANEGTMANVDINGDIEHQRTIANTVATGLPTMEMGYDYIDKEIDPNDGRYTTLKSSPFFDYQDDPHSLAFFPVFDHFVYNASQPKQVAGLFFVMIYWRTYFDDLLPPGADGVFVILENTCQQQYTYKIDGANSAFVGHGDLHDPKYDHLEAGTSVDSVLRDATAITDTSSNSNTNSNSNTTANIECHYSIRVYPSQEFEDNHRTNEPWIHVAILASLFLFTTAVFVVYDCMVERRQRVVLESAKQSGQLVNALFPEEVRDQLYQEQQEKANNASAARLWENNEADLWGNQTLAQDAPTETAPEHKKAIASLYPETTIFFADLVGFTSWSGKRTPVEVFQLLEALYGAFDAIALRRKIFKVETIGDCYVAATGLPQAQPDHAVIMCKFANDCMTKMKVMTASLSVSLGEDTAELAMRVGLHSGSVTAGVLRGAKSRFQLFGDTVNVAARMESNGLANRIHVSEETATALRAKGKSSWLTPRPDKIVAKGKGELQTYFVDIAVKSALSDFSAMTEPTVGTEEAPSAARSGNTGGHVVEKERRGEDLAGLTEADC